MARLVDITTRVITLLGSESSLSADEVESLIQTCYERIYETRGWSKRLRDFGIALVAQIESSDTTTVTVTTGSPTITAIGTPFTAAMSGRQMQLGAERQYFFVNFVSASTLTLQDGEGNDLAWPGATASGTSWRLYKTIYPLPKDAEGVISLASDAPLMELDGGRDRLDTMDPDRQTTDSNPTYWLYAGADRRTAGREIEIWPVPSQARLLRGQYQRAAMELSPNTILDLPTPVLVYAGAADACHLLHAKQGTTEAMWENKALFFDRRLEEVRKEYAITDLELSSPPTHLMRSTADRRSQFAGSDYEVTHQLDSL